MSIYSVIGWACFGAACIFLVAFLCWLISLAIGHDRPDAQHVSGEHHWFGSRRFQAALTARYGPVRDRLDDLTDRFHAAPTHVPAPVAPSPEAPHTPPPAGAGTSTRMHAVEIHPVHKYAAAAWQHASATPNQAKGYWQAADRGDFTESAWTKRSALDLAIKLAEEALDGFDHIVGYATSGLSPRWTEVA